MKNPQVSVVIPVYKNKELFLKNLRANISFLKGMEVIVVDDASHENIEKSVHEISKDIIVIEQSRNLGFAPTVNNGCNKAHGKYIILLNSDVRLTHSIPKSLLSEFERDEKLFGISFRQKEKDGSFVGKNKIFFAHGFPVHSKATDLTKGLNGWAEGGSCVVSADKFRELGGLREIYKPFYWEDIDLSFRAYSRGWHVLFDSSVVVEHHHESTIRKYYKKAKINSIAYRNQFIFTWTNITDASLWVQHLIQLPIFLVKGIFRGDISALTGFLQALVKIPQLLPLRSDKKIHEAVQDVDIFKMSS